MKKWMTVLVVVMMAVPALAQLAGLPIAGGALADAGLRASGGIMVGDDFNMYGVRATFSPAQGLALFGDAGALDPDHGDMGWAFQGGAQFTLPLGAPVDLALRGVAGLAGYDFDGGDVSMLDLNGGLVVSKTIEQLTPYGFVGINYIDSEVDIDHGGKVSDDETDLAVAAGVSFALNEKLSFYAEIAHIDDPFFGGGARVNF